MISETGCYPALAADGGKGRGLVIASGSNLTSMIAGLPAAPARRGGANASVVVTSPWPPWPGRGRQIRIDEVGGDGAAGIVALLVHADGAVMPLRPGRHDRGAVLDGGGELLVVSWKQPSPAKAPRSGRMAGWRRWLPAGSPWSPRLGRAGPAAEAEERCTQPEWSGPGDDRILREPLRQPGDDLAELHGTRVPARRRPGAIGGVWGPGGPGDLAVGAGCLERRDEGGGTGIDGEAPGGRRGRALGAGVIWTSVCCGCGDADQRIARTTASRSSARRSGETPAPFTARRAPVDADADVAGIVRVRVVEGI